MANFENQYQNDERFILNEIQNKMDYLLVDYLLEKNGDGLEEKNKFLDNFSTLNKNEKRIYLNFIANIIQTRNPQFIIDNRNNDDEIQLKGLQNDMMRLFETYAGMRNNYNYYDGNEYYSNNDRRIGNNLILSGAGIKRKEFYIGSWQFKTKDSYNPVKDTQIIQEGLFGGKIIINGNEVIDYVQSGDIMTFSNQGREERINIKSIPSNQSIKIEINNIFLYIEGRNRPAGNHRNY